MSNQDKRNEILIKFFEFIDRFKKNKSVSKNEMYKVQVNIKRQAFVIF